MDGGLGTLSLGEIQGNKSMSCKCILPHVHEKRVARKGIARLLPFAATYYCTHCQETTTYLIEILRKRRRDSRGRKLHRI